MKTCTRCGKQKDLSKFYSDKTHCDGRGSRCKECVKEVSRIFYPMKADKIKERSRRYNRSEAGKLTAERRKPYAANWQKQNRDKCNSSAKRSRDNIKGTKKYKIFHIWRGLKGRCCNEKHKDYKYYGGKGIRICEGWLEDFDVFKDWALINGYEGGMVLHRKNSNGNYEPYNCKWMTKSAHAKHHADMRNYG